MEEKTKRLLKILTGVIAALVFGVLVFSFFTFTENNYTAEYGNFINIIASNVSVSRSSSSGFYVFSRRSSDADSSEDTETESGESGSGSEELSSSEAGSGSVSSAAPPSSGASSENSGSSAEQLVSSSGNSVSSEPESDDAVPILGASVLTKTQLLKYSAPNMSKMRLTCSCEELIELYLSVGAKYGVRGDIAYLQAIKETGWFKFNRPDSYLKYDDAAKKWVRIYEPRPEGLYVVPEDNNFCGLGVTGRLGDEASLCRFATAALGVEAQIQHLYAYACKSPLPAGTTRVDPRFDLVDRGCAANWDDLGDGKWAADPYYGSSLVSTYKTVLNNY